MNERIAAHMALVKKWHDDVMSPWEDQSWEAVEASARALAQGEPGEATPAPPPCATCNGEGGWERANSSTSYSWQKCPHCHLSPTASAPAAERPPYCGSGHCSCIECPYGETNEP